MIRIRTRRSGNKTEKSLRKILRGDIFRELDRHGKDGVRALARATPVETGLSAESWGYRVIRSPRPGIEWYNTNEVNGTSVIILLQYGHGTRNGGYVRGRDFINPAIRPIFDQIAEDVWKKVRDA